MKLKYDFEVREIAGDYVLVPMGEAALKLSGMITTNDVGVFLWKQLRTEITKEELLRKLVEEFEIDLETAGVDVDEYIEELWELDLLVE